MAAGELEHAQRRLTARSVSVSALTAGVIDALHDEIGARGVVVYAEPAGGELRMTGDPSVLQPPIVELCRNEIAQAKPGERIALRAQRHGNHVWISVLGMSGKPAELSLAAARQMESALAAAGGGFTLRPLDGRLAYVAMLPLRPVADAHPRAAQRAAEVGVAGRLVGLFVMAIDDQEEARDALEAVLAMSGARVRLAASGAEALDWLRATDAARWPHVLLCDIVLAGEDGYDVLRRLRELEAEQPASPARLPAIALTGHADAVGFVRAQTAGFDAHLHKPVSPDELIAIIRRLANASAREGTGLP